MKVTIEMELSDREVRQLRDSSIERVHQTAVLVHKENVKKLGQRQVDRDLWMNLQDLQEFGPLANKLWNSARNAAYIASAEQHNKDYPDNSFKPQ